MTKSMSTHERREMDQRLQSFLIEFTRVSHMEPRERYLYPIMKGVPFSDLETALMMATIDYAKAANENS